MISNPENPLIEAFFDPVTATVTYLVFDEVSRVAAIIDPVLDFDPRSGGIRTDTIDVVLASAAALGLKIDRVLETHAHADHLSAAQVVRARTGARVGIGARIGEVQAAFAPMFGAQDVAQAGATLFEDLFEDGARFALGALEVEVLASPGHTPACVAYRIGDAVFVGDTLFMPDFGSARCDFPGGDARVLYRSIRRLLDLPPQTRLFVGHDYPAGAGRKEAAWETTVAEQRRANKHVHDGVDEAAFVAMRQGRDAGLEAPALLLSALQVNIRAGRLPPPDAEGQVFLLIPLTGAAVAGLG